MRRHVAMCRRQIGGARMALIKIKMKDQQTGVISDGIINTDNVIYVDSLTGRIDIYMVGGSVIIFAGTLDDFYKAINRSNSGE